MGAAGYTREMSARPILLLGVLALVCLPAGAAAQAFEAVGIRALGMGGAFVAVADDASATYWNPAGLVTGPVFSMVAEHGRGEAEGFRPPVAAVAPNGFPVASRAQSGTLVALGTWPLGATFYRVSRSAALTVPVGPDGRSGTSTGLSRLTTSHYGVNVLQTLVDGLHVGATLKYVYGTAGSENLFPAPLSGDPLGAAGDLSTRGSHRFDMDAGLMLDLARVKVGVTARNLTRPSFDTPIEGSRLRLDRQVRTGVALRAAAGLTVSVDADLTTASDPLGDWRSLAAGVEQWFAQDRAALRGGVRISTRGDTRPTVTAGGSLSLRSGIFADGYVGVGLDEASPDTFGVGIRVSF
jgi:hypothetical protein